MLIKIDTDKMARILKRHYYPKPAVLFYENTIGDLAKYFKKTATGTCGAVDDCQAPCGYKCPYPDELSCNDCKCALANFDPEDFIKKCGG